MGQRYRILVAATSVFLLVAVAACGGDHDASELGDGLPSESNEDPADESSDDGEVTERGTVPNVDPVDVGTATLTMDGETFTFTDDDGDDTGLTCEPFFQDQSFKVTLSNDYVHRERGSVIFITLPFQQIATPSLSFNGLDFGPEDPAFEANWHNTGPNYIDEWQLSEDGLHAQIQTDVHPDDAEGTADDSVDESELIPITVEVTCPSP